MLLCGNGLKVKKVLSEKQKMLVIPSFSPFPTIVFNKLDSWRSYSPSIPKNLLSFVFQILPNLEKIESNTTSDWQNHMVKYFQIYFRNI